MKIYVGNLKYTMTDSELGALFTPHGSVVSARIVNDHFTRQSKCFGYVEMSNSKDGDKAVVNLHGKKISNLRLVVKEARPRDERQGQGW
ncbi:MAG: RNA-binding protein [Desulfobulbaceae bacterium]|nr:RNA-binding protein [Desulfobulbaceae bacterium]HIJ79362.1 RNA-binding protein [Deltaproteobacteria bacterium]